MPLHSQLNQLHSQLPPRREGPLWRGPEEDGVTFSLLSRFLACRERFRLLVVEGLVPADRWDHKLGFGNMWHVCEETLAKGGMEPWHQSLIKYTSEQCKRYPTQQGEITHWGGICHTQFPLYIRHWKNHPDQLARKPLLQEQVFCMPCKLPSGRVVKLRGKWDSVDLVGTGKGAGIFLQENKTKSRIDQVRMVRQLSFDLQTMLYLVALHESVKIADQQADGWDWSKHQIKGVRYNVVKRTEHRQGKKETAEGFLERLGGIIETDPEEWFYRWNIIITAEDVAEFRRQCLDPILEQLCDWWEWVGPKTTERRLLRGESVSPFDYPPIKQVNGQPALQYRCQGIHWRHPFGVYNVLDEGGSSDLDNYLATGQEAGLRRATTLFPELEGD